MTNYQGGALVAQRTSPKSVRLNPLEEVIVRHVALVNGAKPLEIDEALAKGRADYQYCADWAEALQIEWERRNPEAAAELRALAEEEE